MKKIFNRKQFWAVFTNLQYREKFDFLLLEFFGLEQVRVIKKEDVKENAITLSFVVFLNTEELLTVVVVDTKSYFNSSKTFYINFSYQHVKRYFAYLIPGYLEIYCPYAFFHPSRKKRLLLFASLFFTKNKREVKKILSQLQLFSEEEIKEILIIL